MTRPKPLTPKKKWAPHTDCPQVDSLCVTPRPAAAASATEVAIGPAVSWVAEIGTIPVRLTNPTVGLTPTTELATDGLRMEPDVSVPTVIVTSAAAAETAGPELDPLGVWLASYGLSTWPPRPLYPDGMPAVVKLANSVRFALPRTIAPAARNRPTRKASRRGNECCSASAPAVVGSPATSMLSLTANGSP